MPRVDRDPTLVAQLHRLLLALEASQRVVLPSSNHELLQSIVEAAARIFGAAAASIALVDEAGQHLEFKVSYSPGVGNESVIGLRIPIDQGIAGYVAMTGQPLALSDVRNNALFNQSFAESTGYVPNCILATPLLHGERVIGVMEVLDKLEAPSFGLEDMELLGLFANQAALAIYQSQQYERLGAALVRGLKQLLDPATQAETAELLAALDQAAAEAEHDHDLLDLADLFNGLSRLGAPERALCLRVLGAFDDYARAHEHFG
jgi:GAF domain-containing protein